MQAGRSAYLHLRKVVIPKLKAWNRLENRCCCTTGALGDTRDLRCICRTAVSTNWTCRKIGMDHVLHMFNVERKHNRCRKRNISRDYGLVSDAPCTFVAAHERSTSPSAKNSAIGAYPSKLLNILGGLISGSGRRACYINVPSQDRRLTTQSSWSYRFK